ncbi:SAV_6107 family HEPN domain-containing protein [Amycolatopsis plumensis]|uniref:SAV_6107 family HEPN domain-containing protein n=1 Tax=Amycolatopsis plumensis TaxID=236508 RepID=A0ABV5U8C8_9PSEU
MSVKVVSPADHGQPELPMSLRPQPAPAGPGRSRQCLTPGAEPRHRPAAADSRQPQLPIPLCTSAAERPDSLPASGAGQSELPDTAIPEQTRPPRTGRPAVADPGQLELPDSAEFRQPVAPSPATRPTDASHAESAGSPQSRPVGAGADSGRPVVADSGPVGASAPAQPPAVSVPAVGGASDRPVPEAPAGAELPMSLRPPGADSDQSQLPMSLRPPASPAAAGLLAQARRGLAEATQETRPAERFIGAYLAALRGAAAVLAARGRPHRGRARPASTWVLLDSVAPELREWSAFFASNSATRAAAQAGITGKVTAESAAGLVGAATPFLELVRRLVHGLPITGEAHVA